MPFLALVCAGLLGWVDDGGSGADLAAEYRQVQAGSGRTAADQVRLALWCEAHGLTAERVRHLTLAVLADPTHATARGLLGMVARNGRWVAPTAIAESARTDAATAALLAEYDLKRSKTPYTADAQWSLGAWADEQGLPDQARAHFTAVTRLDPGREVAWKRLGYKKHNGQWMTDAQVTEARAEADAQKRADRTWQPLLEKWKGMLARPSQSDEAHAALLGVTDPRAVAAIGRVFATDRATDQQVAVGLLGQIESPQASRGLAALAVFSSSPDVRRVAVETLRQRDPRDFVGLWIALIRSPIKYEVQPVGGPGSPGVLFVQGQKANTQRIYRPLDAPNLANTLGGVLVSDEDGLPVLVFDQGLATNRSAMLTQQQMDVMRRQEALSLRNFGRQLNRIPGISAQTTDLVLDAVAASSPIAPETVNRLTAATSGPATQTMNQYVPVVERKLQIPVGQMMIEAQRSAVVAQAQLANDVAGLDRQNATIRQNNEPVLLALGDITSEHYGEDPIRWNQWWVNEQGYAVMESSTASTPTFVENVPIGFTPTAAPVVTNQPVGYAHPRHSCFAAKTLVRTVDGSRAIEQIRRGDQVLVQDTVTGALTYQPVLNAFHNPPSSTYRVKVGDDEVVATGIHRFWKAGKGWTMARDLKVGDLLRVLGGVATVEAVDPDQTQPVFNLEVAEGQSFFVGRVGALVHDNSLVEATPNPFDAAAGPVAAVVGKASGR